jgi:aspartate carbamoyltransferase regulatory subunit
MSDTRQLLVRRIKDGTVIDHIESGKALLVLRTLDITGKEGNVITVALNVPSSKHNKKDIIKVENRFLEKNETNKLALIAPHATINIIKDYKLVEKRKIQLPDSIVGVFKCTNLKCVNIISSYVYQIVPR